MKRHGLARLLLAAALWLAGRPASATLAPVAPARSLGTEAAPSLDQLAAALAGAGLDVEIDAASGAADSGIATAVATPWRLTGGPCAAPLSGFGLGCAPARPLPLALGIDLETRGFDLVEALALPPRASGLRLTRPENGLGGRALFDPDLASGTEPLSLAGPLACSDFGCNLGLGSVFFLTKDPFDGVPEIPASLNAYLYGHGNPLYFVDPSGQCVLGLPCPAVVQDQIDNTVATAEALVVTAAQVVGGVATGTATLAVKAVDVATLGAIPRLASRLGAEVGYGGSLAERHAAGNEASSAKLDEQLGSLRAVKDTVTSGEALKNLARSELGIDQMEAGAEMLSAGLAEGDQEAVARGLAQMVGGASQGVLALADRSKAFSRARRPPASHVQEMPDPPPAVGKVDSKVNVENTNAPGALAKPQAVTHSVDPTTGAPAPGAAPKILIVPKEKAGNFAAYQQAEAEGRLVRTDPKTVRGSGFRTRTAAEHGPAPSGVHQADHVVELCVGGPDCAKTNSQWLEGRPNQAAGAKFGAQVKNDPPGTKYTVRLEGHENDP